MAARSQLAWPCLAVDGQDAVKVVAFVLQQLRQRSRQSAPMVRAACEAQDENGKKSAVLKRVPFI